MAAPQQPPPPQHGIIFDLVSQIFAWLDKPWKAFAIAGLAILVALGWGGWLSRDALVDAWKMSSGRPILKRSELDATLAHLRSETGADIVAFSSLNLSANALNFEKGIGLYGKDWDFTPHRLPAIREPFGGTRALAEIMAGHIICRAPEPTTTDGDLFNRRMLADNIHRLCLVPVPPAPNILVGILMLAWVAAPDASTEEAALGLARETASTMVSRWE